MTEEQKYIWKLADFLTSQETVMSGKEVVKHLNRNDFSTVRGKPYKGGRGVYNLFKSTYKELDKKGLPEEASKIAWAFVNEDGTPAWKED